MSDPQNPFRTGLARGAAPQPSAFVLFGATGDLTARKLVPALYNLAKEGLTPQEFYVLGVARKPKTDDEFRAEMRDAVGEFSRSQPIDEAVWQQFAARLGYQPCEFSDPAGYQRLKSRLEKLDAEFGLQGNRLHYLAVAPEFFKVITTRLSEAGIFSGRHVARPWTRVVIEKPFGTDLASAQSLSRHLDALLSEDQIYRIDHYLGKETVQNILTMRFGNAIFEPLWNRRYIKQIQITVAETVGMEGRRGPYYDQAGASRDMVQNHMMQLLALVAMEPPVAWDADAIRDEKAKVLRALSPLTPEEVFQTVLRARYTRGSRGGEEVPGYLEESGVDPESVTDTFVAMRLQLQTWRWSGVPFYLRHGKRLPKRATEIAIEFRQPPLLLFEGHAAEGNSLVFRIQPDEGISLSFLSKVPGMRLRRQPVKMDFTYQSAFGIASPEAYERLVLDALSGDGTLFTRSDEVEYAWRFVGSILDGWAQQPPETVASYPAGTWGPAEADTLLRDGAVWRRL